MEDILKDYSGRRTGLLRAFTEDVETFHAECDPGKENLCVYGHPNETWEVTLPAEEVPAELPEPALGINFTRDAMKNRREWLLMVALHSNSWLLSVAFLLAAPLNRDEREKLFSCINDVPTLASFFDTETIFRASKKVSLVENVILLFFYFDCHGQW